MYNHAKYSNRTWLFYCLFHNINGTNNTLTIRGKGDLIASLKKEAAKAGIVQEVLLEVNIGGEESKTGVAPEALWPLLDAAAAQEHIRVKGLMAIPPVNDDDARNRRYLAEVYKLFVQAGDVTQGGQRCTEQIQKQGLFVLCQIGQKTPDQRTAACVVRPGVVDLGF